MLLIIVGFYIWYFKSDKKENIQTSVSEYNSMASSSPDLVRRMAIAELPEINGNSNYRKDNNYVYYGTDIVSGADPNTFSIIDDQFAKDKTRVYSGGDLLEDSDSNTFVVGPIPHDKFNVYLHLICEDNVWALCYRKIQSADPVTFQLLTYGFSKDKNHVFYGTKIIPEADVSTFAIHDGGKYGYTYGYDKDKIFVRGYERIGIIRKKCNILDQIRGYYLKCDDNVYYVDKLLSGADVKTMIPVGVTSNYAKDSKSVYFDGEIVVGADSETFTIGDGINATDKNYTYRFGKRVE